MRWGYNRPWLAIHSELYRCLLYLSVWQGTLQPVA
jgi:hypothetical protein